MSKDKQIQFKVIVDGKEAIATIQTLDDTVEQLGSVTREVGNASRTSFENFSGKSLALNQALQALRESSDLLNATFGSAVQAYDEQVKSNLKLESASKLTGVELEQLQQISQESAESFSLSERQSNEFTISLSKLASKSGDVNQTSSAIQNLLNVASAQGLNPEQALVAIQQAMLGIDEGTDKLFQKNPSVIYAEFASSIGTTAGKLTEAQKAQALLTELQQTSSKVGESYLAYLDSAAGKQAVFAAELEKTQVAIGDFIRTVTGPLLQAGNSYLSLFNAMPDSLQGLIGTSALLVVALKTLQTSGIVPNLGVMRALRLELAGVSFAFRTGAGASAVFSAGVHAATQSVRAFFGAIPVVGWIALGLSAIPVLYDLAKGFFTSGNEADTAAVKLAAFRSEIAQLPRLELESNLASKKAEIAGVEQAITILQEKLLRSRNLTRQERSDLASYIGEYQKLVETLKLEYSALSDRLNQIDSAKPGEEGFRTLSERINEAETLLKAIAENSIDGIIPESERAKAELLKNELNKLRQIKEELFKDLGLTQVTIPVKPVIEPVQPADIVSATPELSFDIELSPRFPDYAAVATEFKAGLMTNISTVNEALTTLAQEFANATDDQSRQRIQSLTNELNLFKAQLDASGFSTEELAKSIKDGLLQTTQQFDTALAGLEQQLSVTFDSSTQAEIQKWINELRELKSTTTQLAQNVELNFGPVIAQGLTEVGTALGEMLGSGEMNMKNFGLAIMGALANAMKSIGTMMISLGVATKAAQFSPDPATWIISGVVLLAAGAALAGMVNRSIQKETQGASEQPQQQRFNGPAYKDGGIVETRTIAEVGEAGAEMILTAPATEKLRPFFKELNSGMLPTIPVPQNINPTVNTNIGVTIDGGFKVSGNDLLTVINRRIKIEKALGRDIMT